MNTIARTTTKGHTIPRKIRDALHVVPDDQIVWEALDDGTARVRHIRSLDLDYLRALEGTLTEWSGTADEEAYRDL
ncbi:MAG: AbrB family transcriptional regulator [Magnetococcales bacterium]|nr:AbrB family transcriptional regulator [Magnetococcales bacterium]